MTNGERYFAPVYCYFKMVFYICLHYLENVSFLLYFDIIMNYCVDFAKNVMEYYITLSWLLAVDNQLDQCFSIIFIVALSDLIPCIGLPGYLLVFLLLCCNLLRWFICDLLKYLDGSSVII